MPNDVPVSPELALVCPELAAAARASLPERDPDGFLPRRRDEAQSRPLAVGTSTRNGGSAQSTPSPAARTSFALPVRLLAAALLYALVGLVQVVVPGMVLTLIVGLLICLPALI